MALTYTSRREFEIQRFSAPATIGVPLLALFLQSFLPLRLPFVSVFDLPLLVTIYFSVARRSQLAGLFTGSIIGLVQDSLTHQPIGLYGIAKGVVGYAASSLGVRIDVDSIGTRFLMTGFFYLAHHLVYFLVARGLVQQALEWQWRGLLLAALANAILAVFLFAALDRLRLKD